jgi:hypothetical protein
MGLQVKISVQLTLEKHGDRFEIKGLSIASRSNIQGYPRLHLQSLEATFSSLPEVDLDRCLFEPETTAKNLNR